MSDSLVVNIISPVSIDRVTTIDALGSSLTAICFALIMAGKNSW
jgi:hypothetical protein